MEGYKKEALFDLFSFLSGSIAGALLTTSLFVVVYFTVR